MIRIKNIRQFKTTIAGVLFIIAAFAYLFWLEKENNTIFFGLLVLGIFLIFAPDTIFKSGSKVLLRILGITTKGNTNIEIDDVEINHKNEIPDER